MVLYLALWLSVVLWGLIILWSRRQARLAAELKQQFEDSQRELAALQARVERTLGDVAVLTRQEGLQDESTEPPARNTVH